MFVTERPCTTEEYLPTMSLTLQSLTVNAASVTGRLPTNPYRIQEELLFVMLQTHICFSEFTVLLSCRQHCTKQRDGGVSTLR